MGNDSDDRKFLEKLSDASVQHRVGNNRPTEWAGKTLTTMELLDALRRNHVAMNRSDSPYWQAELKILSLLDSLSMIQELAAHDNDIRFVEIRRLARLANE